MATKKSAKPKPPKPQRHQSPTLDREGRARRALSAAGHSPDHLTRMTAAEVDALAELLDETGSVLHLDEAGQPISAREFGRRVKEAETLADKPRLSRKFCQRFDEAFAPHAARMAAANAQRQAKPDVVNDDEAERSQLVDKGLLKGQGSRAES